MKSEDLPPTPESCIVKAGLGLMVLCFVFMILPVACYFSLAALGSLR